MEFKGYNSKIVSADKAEREEDLKRKQILFITLMTKMSDTAEAKYKYDKNSPKLSRAPQGRRLGDERLEVLVVLVALSELPRVGRN